MYPVLPNGWVYIEPVATTVDQLIDQAGKLSNPNWNYRGESKYYGKRQSSFGRMGWEGRSAKDLLRIELQALHLFQRYSVGHMSPFETAFADTVVDWLILMQHHGAPTRLLDWSGSIWVSIYHAISNFSHDKECSYIWCYDVSKLLATIPSDWISLSMQLCRAKTGKEYQAILGDAGPFWGTFGSIEATPRMLMQQGLYTLANPIDAAHCELIGKIAPPGTCGVLRIDGRDLKRALMQKFLQMNLNAAVLFPSIDGAGRMVREAFDWGLNVPSMTSNSE